MLISKYTRESRESKSHTTRVSTHMHSDNILLNFSPYIKGLPITTTILSSNERGDHSEEIIRPTYEDPYTLEYKQWYEVLQGKKEAKTTPADGMSTLFDQS